MFLHIFFHLLLGERDDFLSFANRRVPHELLETWCRKDERQADIVIPNVGDRNPSIGGDEDSGGPVNFFYSVSQTHAFSAALQQKDFICPRMSVSGDLISWLEIFRAQNQMRGTAIFRVNFQNEKWISGGHLPNSPLTFVLLNDEGSCPGYVRRLRLWCRLRGGTNAHQDYTNLGNKMS